MPMSRVILRFSGVKVEGDYPFVSAARLRALDRRGLRRFGHALEGVDVLRIHRYHVADAMDAAVGARV